MYEWHSPRSHSSKQIHKMLALKTELHLEVNIRLPLDVLLSLNLPVRFLSLALCFSHSGETL